MSDEISYGWSCAETPAVSALSPSGARLAFAIEETKTPTDENVVDTAVDSRDHLHRPASPRPQDSLARDGDHRANLPLVQYRITITSSGASCIYSKSAVAAVDQTSEERSLASSWSFPPPPLSTSSSSNNKVATYDVKAPVTTLQWLDESHLACGLQDGTVTIIARRRSKISSERWSENDQGCGDWTPTLSRCFHRAQGDENSDGGDKARRVVCIRLSGEGLAGGGGGATGATRGSEPTLWVLYGDRVVVCVSVRAVIALARHRSGSFSSSPSSATSNNAPPNDNGRNPASPSPGPTFVKIQLEGQEEILDVVACPASAGLFEVRSDRHSHVILAAGVSPSLAFYPIGSETRSFGLASIAWAVASHVTSLTVGAIDGIFGFVGLRGRGKKPAANTGRGGGGGSEDGDVREESPPPLVLRWDGGLQDGWRRVAHLCLDPSGRLAAAADGFGRVMLVDCATRQILRMWKGVRHAECGWLEVEESWEGRRVASVGQGRLATAACPLPGEAVATPAIGLYLAILAPLRGRVELWRMRHGPCVRVIPAPARARLLTSRPRLVASAASLGVDGSGGERRGSHAGDLTSCYLLSGGEGTGRAQTRLRLSPLLVEEADLADLPSSWGDRDIAQWLSPVVLGRRLGCAAEMTGLVPDRGGVSASACIVVTETAAGLARFSREPMVDDDYRLRKFAAAVADVRNHGRSTTTTGEREKMVGERERLPAGQAAREEALFQLLSQLESPESLARATASLEKGSTKDGAICLSISFQRRTCALCRERADEATAATTKGDSTAGSKDGSSRAERDAAISALRFRAAAFELYTVLEAVELQPAGAGGDDENGEPAFLPPGKRGWRHALLCEEAAGWADMERGGTALHPMRAPSVELPEFQEFLETASVVLTGREPDPRLATLAVSDRRRTPPMLQFVTNAEERSGSEVVCSTSRSRRSSRSSESPSELSFAGDASTHKGDVDVTPADRAVDHAICRERLVGWLFRPLLSDAFAMASLTRALSILGLGGKEQAGVLVRDMAAWFLALPVGRAADITVGREAQNCPVLRWLKGIILLVSSPSSSAPLTAWDSTSAGPGRGKEFESEKAALGKKGRTFDLFGDPLDEDAGSDGEGSTSDGSDNGSTGVAHSASASATGSDEQRDEQEAGSDRENLQAHAEEVLRPMYETCAASERLENASMLSVVVAEALSACREKLEESSLGQVALGGEEAWATLARRLRLCLFVDHRLHWGMRAEHRDRASVRRFQEGKASVYAVIAKDQLMSFTDLSFAACSSRENTETEASARSQRETAEAKAAGRRPTSERLGALGSSALIDEADAGRAVAAAPSLVDVRMDEHWCAVQAVATRNGHAPTITSLPGITPALGLTAYTGFSGGSANKATQRRKPAAHEGNDAADDAQLVPTDAPSDTPPTTLFFMRSHAQPIVLACHRTRWLVLSWAATGPASVESLERATDSESIMKAVNASEAAVRRLSLAVDHLSYLRTAKPFLAGCIAYSLWEHGGVRSHVRDVARGPAHSRGNGDEALGLDNAGGLVEEGRPAREAFLAAAEEFLRVEALFVGCPEVVGRDWQGGAGGRGGNPGRSGGQGSGSDVSFMSLLTEGAMRRCGWPGAWDRWIEECLRDAQVHPPLQSAVAAHMTLLRALRVSTICGLAEKETLGLFEKGHTLCAESSLRNERLVAPSAPNPALDSERRAVGGKEGEHVLARREAYIRRALEAIVPRPAQNVYRLARDFGVSEEAVRGWHCVVLLRRGHDVLGEEALSQIFSLQELAGDVLTVMRLRLKRFLDFLEASPGSSRGLLANLDADTCQWVRAAKDPEAVSRAGQGGVQSEKEQGEPLRSTHGVLLCLARALPRDSRHKLQANALVTLVGTMLQHLGGAGATFHR